MAEEYKSFTLETPEGHNFSAIISTCVVYPAFNPKNVSAAPKGVQVNALWDTGATNTVITKNVIDQLGLKPVGKTKTYHANGESIVDVYYINLMLPNKLGRPFLKVTVGVLTGFDVLIGMDIIGDGEFSITHKDNKSIFTFSLEHPKDLIGLPQSQPPSGVPKNTNQPPFSKKVGRNELCPCKSGKKYKHCHGVGQ